ncbi:MAG: DNA polymerase III subunit gamma/tau [Alphaproteobacteria bacterium]|nr:DNA polymerase III subunit gamma/tau [Alphaproteobacteria bacterium]
MQADTGTSPYRVLARKYRPQDFAGLVGQDAMVRTLSNAIAQGRLAHAFVLTGVRGVGKTTTARIIARALNCIGTDGKGGPTIQPCGVCENCRAIAEDRHVDVIEMDAASRTGVDDIREVIEGVRYKPVVARYKIYIIDEVHMLSRNAFNALLKTLEEPPEHVKFIFATTEIRKVPVTVLSRCQRFDLRRIERDELAKLFTDVAAKEGATVEPGAIELIAYAADGSARDGLSILDQAIALGGGAVSAQQTRDMLGLADRGETFELFEALMRGDVAAALARVGELYRAGADPIVLVQDLLELAHWLTRVKLAPEATSDHAAGASETEIKRGGDMAQRLSIANLTRAWQMLLKGLGEVQQAPQPLAALEMLIVRLAYAADLPTPGDLVRALRADGGSPATAGGGNGSGVSAAPHPRASAAVGPSIGSGGTALAGAPRAELDARPSAEARTEAAPADPQTFEQVVALFEARRESELRTRLLNNVHLVAFEPGRIEFRPAGAPADLANRVGLLLTQWTGRRWVVAVSQTEGAPTLAEQRRAASAKRLDQAAEHPLVRAVLDAFPGAAITAIRDLNQPLAAAPAEGAGVAEEARPTPGDTGPAGDSAADLVFDSDSELPDGDESR